MKSCISFLIHFYTQMLIIDYLTIDYILYIHLKILTENLFIRIWLIIDVDFTFVAIKIKFFLSSSMFIISSFLFK